MEGGHQRKLHLDCQWYIPTYCQLYILTFCGSRFLIFACSNMIPISIHSNMIQICFRYDSVLIPLSLPFRLEVALSRTPQVAGRAMEDYWSTWTPVRPHGDGVAPVINLIDDLSEPDEVAKAVWEGDDGNSVESVRAHCDGRFREDHVAYICRTCGGRVHQECPEASGYLERPSAALEQPPQVATATAHDTHHWIGDSRGEALEEIRSGER